MNHGLLTEEESHCIVASGNILFEELEGSSKQRSCWSKQSPRKGAYNMILQELRLSFRMNTETFQVNTVRIICKLLSVIYYFLEFWFISFSPPPPLKSSPILGIPPIPHTAGKIGFIQDHAIEKGVIPRPAIKKGVIPPPVLIINPTYIFGLFKAVFPEFWPN